MTENVVEGGFVTNLPIAADKVLNAALEAPLKSVVVIGFHDDGSLYFAGSTSHSGEVLYHLKRAQIEIMRLAMEANEP